MSRTRPNSILLHFFESHLRFPLLYFQHSQNWFCSNPSLQVHPCRPYSIPDYTSVVQIRFFNAVLTFLTFSHFCRLYFTFYIVSKNSVLFLPRSSAIEAFELYGHVSYEPIIVWMRTNSWEFRLSIFSRSFRMRCNVRNLRIHNAFAQCFSDVIFTLTFNLWKSFRISNRPSEFMLSPYKLEAFSLQALSSSYFLLSWKVPVQIMWPIHQSLVRTKKSYLHSDKFYYLAFCSVWYLWNPLSITTSPLNKIPALLQVFWFTSSMRPVKHCSLKNSHLHGKERHLLTANHFCPSDYFSQRLISSKTVFSHSE